MHFIFFSLTAFAALAVASPTLKDRVGLSGGSAEARGLALGAAKERRQVDTFYHFDTRVSDQVAKRRGLPLADPKHKRQWWDWLYWDDEVYGDEDYWDEDYGNFDQWVTESTAKRRSIPSPSSKHKRQWGDWFYDDDDNAAKAKA